MNAAKQAAWLFCALIALACTGWYFASASPTSKLDAKTLAKMTDATITHLTVRQFDATGRLVNYLETPLLQHASENNTHRLQTPHIILSQADQPSWDIRAKEAVALNGGQQITFSKDVIIHQEKSEHSEESTLTTDEITYFPKDKLASTLMAVTYKQPGSIIESKGMKAWLAEKRVVLLSQARGIYEPNHH